METPGQGERVSAVTPERWQQVERVYYEVLAGDVADRPALLDESCAGDDALRREVLALLEGDGDAEHFLSDPALDVVARATPPPAPSLLSGTQIGAYRILRTGVRCRRRYPPAFARCCGDVSRKSARHASPTSPSRASCWRRRLLPSTLNKRSFPRSLGVHAAVSTSHGRSPVSPDLPLWRLRLPQLVRRDLQFPA